MESVHVITGERSVTLVREGLLGAEPERIAGKKPSFVEENSAVILSCLNFEPFGLYFAEVGC